MNETLKKMNYVTELCMNMMLSSNDERFRELYNELVLLGDMVFSDLSDFDNTIKELEELKRIGDDLELYSS